MLLSQLRFDDEERNAHRIVAILFFSVVNDRINMLTAFIFRGHGFPSNKHAVRLIRLILCWMSRTQIQRPFKGNTTECLCEWICICWIRRRKKQLGIALIRRVRRSRNIFLIITIPIPKQWNQYRFSSMQLQHNYPFEKIYSAMSFDTHSRPTFPYIHSTEVITPGLYNTYSSSFFLLFVVIPTSA